MNPELFFPHQKHPPARYPTNKNFPPFLVVVVVVDSLSLSSSSFVYIRIPPPKHREGKGFQEQI
jgi:hypothetical protein